MKEMFRFGIVRNNQGEIPWGRPLDIVRGRSTEEADSWGGLSSGRRTSDGQLLQWREESHSDVESSGLRTSDGQLLQRQEESQSDVEEGEEQRSEMKSEIKSEEEQSAKEEEDNDLWESE